MHPLGWLIYGIAFAWLAPGSLWRPVALALLLGWIAAEVWYFATGDFLPLHLYLACDLLVIATVIKWRSHWSDWLIVAAYPLVWWLYSGSETRGQWLALYWIAIAQFVIAGPWPQLQNAFGKISHGSLRVGRVGQ